MLYQSEITAAKAYGNVRIALICTVLAFVPAAQAGFLNPLVTATNINVEAIDYVNAQLVDPSASGGTSRQLVGSGPISDSAQDVYGLNSAFAAASVDSAGLHASGTVHGGASLVFQNLIVNAGTLAFISNPFILVPKPGFTGTQALLEIPYSFGGHFDPLPDLADCPDCQGAVTASLSVNGLATIFSFFGHNTFSAINSAVFVDSVSQAGVFQALVPVNTEFSLVGSLSTGVSCAPTDLSSCDDLTDFSGTLSYTGSSPDAVDFVWGLNPVLEQAGVPEPASLFLLAGGLLGLIAIVNLRRKVC